MASGKTEVARALANRLHMPFVDLDSLIAEDAQMSVAAIFAREKEAGFRVREARMLDQVLAGPASIVATGGGSPCFADNLSKMRTKGTVVHLATELGTALQRAKAQSGPTRPLLQASPAEVEDLFRTRAPVYRRAHISVSTEGKDAAGVASEIEDALDSCKGLPAKLLEDAAVVALRERSYPVVVSRGSLLELGPLLRARLPGLTKLGLISDTTVFGLYGQDLVDSLKAQGIEVVSSTVAPGEDSKELSVFASQCEAMIAGGLDRKSAIVALGGGVVGDLAGFVAASLYRGIALVQVPTTLLAMTDSAIGGKTGINSTQGKNLIGAFWQPSFVLADPNLLATLDKRELRAAFGELVKYALLDDAIWPQVEALASEIAAPELLVGAELCELVRSCAQLKAAVVSEDERERGVRATLNLGHTLAHAIEKAAGYGQVLHGEAVALGLLAACRVSHAIGLCDATLEARVCAVLEAAGLQTELGPWLNSEVLAHLRVDKKRTGSLVRFIALAHPGDVRMQDIELSELTRLLLED